MNTKAKAWGGRRWVTFTCKSRSQPQSDTLWLSATMCLSCYIGNRSVSFFFSLSSLLILLLKFRVVLQNPFISYSHALFESRDLHSQKSHLLFFLFNKNLICSVQQIKNYLKICINKTAFHIILLYSNGMTCNIII